MVEVGSLSAKVGVVIDQYAEVDVSGKGSGLCSEQKYILIRLARHDIVVGVRHSRIDSDIELLGIFDDSIAVAHFASVGLLEDHPLGLAGGTCSGCLAILSWTQLH